MYEQALTDRRRILGPGHPDTLASAGGGGCPVTSRTSAAGSWGA